MSEQVESGATTETKGGADGTQPAASSGATTSEKSVAWENHQRALSDLARFKKEASEAKKQIEELNSQKLKEANDYKTLYERVNQEKTEIESKYTKFQEAYVLNHKYNAVHAEALKAGLRAEAESDLGLLQLDGVAVETTSEGRVLVNGSKEYVESLKKTKPHWFRAGEAPVINAGGAGSSAAMSKITPAMLVAIEKKDPVKYRQMYQVYLEQQKRSG